MKMEKNQLVLSQEDINTFQNQGAVLLKNILSQDWIETLKTGIQRNLDNPSKYSEKLGAPGGTGYYFNDYCNWQDIGEFRDFVYNTGVAELAGRLMRSEYAVFYHEHVLTKDPSTCKRTPWHQDQPYYPIDGFKNVSLWMPVDPVSEQSTIQFIGGSHKWNKWYHPRKFETSNKYSIEQDIDSGHTFEDIPDIDANENEYDILKWPCKPGDCIAFHMLTVHGAPENMMTSPRRVVSFRWLGDDAVIGRRPWQVSPPILGGLSPGDPVQCDTFPLIWRRNPPNL